jgi:CelD/BcsL family acetyltransferase involved in cellulose biosynthesis
MTTRQAGDRLLASHFGLKTSNVWHWWFPAYDLEAYKLGPGINLVDQCAMAAERHGISLIDLGRGDGAFKQLFADRYVDLCEGAITRPGSLAKLIRKGTHSVVSATERLPFGRYKTYPRRAAAKYISGVSLPSKDKSDSDWNVE